MRANGGAAGFVDIVATLLSATFGGRDPSTTDADGAPGEGRAKAIPFPGTT